MSSFQNYDWCKDNLAFAPLQFADRLSNASGYDGFTLVVGGKSYVNGYHSISGTFPSLSACGTSSFSLEMVDEAEDFAKAIGVGDFDGDGWNDIAVGQPNYSVSKTGRIYIVKGPLSGATEIAASDSFRAIQGSQGSEAGFALTFLPDMNGDGAQELMVGAPQHDEVYILLGRDFPNQALPPDFGSSDIIIRGAPDSRFGHSVAYLGDTNGDGFGDLGIGSPQGGSGAGHLNIVYGSESLWSFGAQKILQFEDLVEISGVGVLAGEASNHQLGCEVSALGDMDQDGYADTAIGACLTGAPGRAYVVYGGPDRLQTASVAAQGNQDRLLRVLGGITGDQVGIDIAPAGDVNGDGFGDLLIGSSAGEAYIIYSDSSACRGDD